MKCNVMYPKDFTNRELSGDLDAYFGTTPSMHETVMINFEAKISYTITRSKVRMNLIISIGDVDITKQLKKKFVEKIKVDMGIL